MSGTTAPGDDRDETRAESTHQPTKDELLELTKRLIDEHGDVITDPATEETDELTTLGYETDRRDVLAIIASAVPERETLLEIADRVADDDGLLVVAPTRDIAAAINAILRQPGQERPDGSVLLPPSRAPLEGSDGEVLVFRASSLQPGWVLSPSGQIQLQLTDDRLDVDDETCWPEAFDEDEWCRWLEADGDDDGGVVTDPAGVPIGRYDESLEALDEWSPLCRPPELSAVPDRMAIIVYADGQFELFDAEDEAESPKDADDDTRNDETTTNDDDEVSDDG